MGKFYLTANSINKSYGCNLNDVGQFELFPEYIKKTVKNFTNKKVDTARAISANITDKDIVMDLKDRVIELYGKMLEWSGKGGLQ